MKKSMRRIGSTFCMGLMLFSSFCRGPIHVSAGTTSLQVNDSDGVKLRKGPGTNYDQIGYAQDGEMVEWLDEVVYQSESGCSEGWLKVSYNNTVGYMCKTYLVKPGVASYDRPWTTPQKAIVGGAKFIAQSYVQKGQYTPYLKKFNVNPENTPYTHQYMANLQAPYSEAYSSYKSYRDNDLLKLDLEFSIPVYLNMPDETSHPVNGANKVGQSEIKDPEFEKLLEKEKFPESYRIKLRLLHEQHKNWVFTAMHTNLDFNTAVAQEKKVSSISACEACYEKPKYETEKGWYIANTQTVSYYLDPRNFIVEERVLMFESLAYREGTTESQILSVLKGTFMEGISVLDNLTYPAIFLKAGKEAGISPIYLASLARIESGSKVNTTTSGEYFEYEGKKYQGFYNFYNIGASSGESNPAKAGLVYASKGSTLNADGIFMGSISNSGNTNPSTPDDKPAFDVSKVVNQLDLKQKGSYLANVTVGMTSKELKAKTSSTVTIKNAKGEPLADWEKIGTGTQIVFEDGTIHTVIVYGDLTGDGDINSADLLRMRQYLLGIATLSGSYLESAKICGQAEINSANLLKLRQHLLQTTTIAQI